MSARINRRKIVKNDPNLLLDDVFEYFMNGHLWAETEVYMLAGYLHNHNSDAIVKLHTDYHAPNKWTTITKNTYDPEEDSEFEEYKDYLDNLLKKYS